MAGESVVLDPYTESTSNAPLWLHARGNSSLSTGVVLSADGGHQYPTPEPEAIWIGTTETEGELRGSTRPQRRVIPVTLQIIEPTNGAATNLCTNPVFATGTAGWTNNSLTVFAASRYQITDPAMSFLPGFDTALHATSDADDDNAAFSLAVTNGTPVVFSAWVWVNSGTVRMEVWNATPALFANSANIALGSWQRVTMSVTPNASATWTFRVAQNGAGTANWWMTGVQLGPADPYFDGDTPGCAWTGTRNASTSTRAATGGARYAAIRGAIESKIAKLDQYGGTYRRTLPTGEHIIFDVQAARLVSWQEDPLAEQNRYVKAAIEFTCKPYGRGLEVTV